MQLSYWEYKTWLSNIDYTIIGSGIVGLQCALRLKEQYPKAKVLVLEKGVLPQGASTKNAGFACFGSLSEILSDLKTHTEDEVLQLVSERYEGIQLLRKMFGDKAIGYQQLGGHELFLEPQEAHFEECSLRMEEINQLLTPVFGYTPFTITSNNFGFDGTSSNFITHQFEGQLDTGHMMKELLTLAQRKGIIILNSVEVDSFEENGTGVMLKTNEFDLRTNQLFIATNGFAQKLLNAEVFPARAQVIVTKPINNLRVKGTFHFDEGYYYFRNIDNRILFGGGRNLDFKAEETAVFGQTAIVQNELERILSEVILHDTAYDIDHRWSGIMGVGPQKKPIIKQHSNHVYCGVRLGGMGVAIGSKVGHQLANLHIYG